MAMIHTLAKEYGQDLYHVRNNYFELDFWEFACLNSIQAANFKAKDK